MGVCLVVEKRKMSNASFKARKKQTRNHWRLRLRMKTRNLIWKAKRVNSSRRDFASENDKGEGEKSITPPKTDSEDKEEEKSITDPDELSETSPPKTNPEDREEGESP